MGKEINDYLHETYGEKVDNDNPRRGRGSGVNWKKYYKNKERLFERLRENDKKNKNVMGEGS